MEWVKIETREETFGLEKLGLFTEPSDKEFDL
jgi:hypothetical protein